MNFEEENQIIKTILIGDEGVGKTSLINVISGRPFNEVEKSTLTASYIKKEFILDNVKYTISLWDTVGQEKLRALSKLFFKNSKIVILVYDITKKNTFDNLISWNNDIKQIIGDDIIKGLIGNKQDLFNDEEVNEIKSIEFANSINAKFRLTSAKTEPAGFSLFLEELLKEYINKTTGKKDKKEENIIIGKEKKTQTKCC